MVRPINVLHVIDSLAAGGAERVLVELVNHVDRSMVIPLVCVTRAGAMTLASAIRSDVYVEQLPRRTTWDFPSLVRFGRIIQQHKIDLVHAHGYSSSRFAVAAKIAMGTVAPVVMHAHDSRPPDIVTCLLGRLGVAHVIGASPQVAEWTRQRLGLQHSHITVLGNAVDPSPFRDARPIEVRGFFAHRPRFVGIVAANVRPAKDFETLFRALAASRFKSNSGILIAGSTADGPYVRQCETLLAQLDLKEEVVFLGSRQDMPRLLASADFGLLSSKRETGPLALLEYMAAGLPLVATRVGQIGERTGQLGLAGIVPPESPRRFAHALDQLLALPLAAQQARGAAGRQLLVEHFSLAAGIRALQALYSSLVDGRSHS